MALPFTRPNNDSAHYTVSSIFGTHKFASCNLFCIFTRKKGCWLLCSERLLFLYNRVGLVRKRGSEKRERERPSGHPALGEFQSQLKDCPHSTFHVAMFPIQSPRSSLLHQYDLQIEIVIYGQFCRYRTSDEPSNRRGNGRQSKGCVACISRVYRRFGWFHSLSFVH